MRLLAVIMAAIIIIGIVVWLTAFAPCDLYKFSAGKDIPGRCLGVEGR